MSLSTKLLGALLIGAGTLHFTHTDRYEAVMPPYLPAHTELVLVSGAAEIAGGAALFLPRLHPFARVWLIALLVAVFPANVHMAVNPEQIEGLSIPTWLLWARLPLQGAAIAWVLHATRDSTR